MHPRNLLAHSIVLRELTLRRALGVSLRTVRQDPAGRTPSSVRRELLTASRPPLLDGFPPAAAPDRWTNMPRR